MDKCKQKKWTETTEAKLVTKRGRLEVYKRTKVRRVSRTTSGI
jgi:hypothetical protein